MQIILFKNIAYNFFIDVWIWLKIGKLKRGSFDTGIVVDSVLVDVVDVETVSLLGCIVVVIVVVVFSKGNSYSVSDGDPPKLAITEMIMKRRTITTVPIKIGFNDPKGNSNLNKNQIKNISGIVKAKISKVGIFSMISGSSRLLP